MGDEQAIDEDVAERQPSAEVHRGHVQADAPIEHRSEDLLERTDLVDAIADQVIHGPPGLGLVIGVVGRWGSGKTSILRLVEEVVRERSHTVVVHFNPWLFSNTDELVVRFLEELGSQLRGEGKRRQMDRLQQAGDRLGAYAESLEPLGWLPVLGPWLSRTGSASRVINAIRTARREQHGAESQRTLVCAELRALDRRVLVVIDDLDRVEPNQVRDIVRLVRLVADFPNTTYLLAYDRTPVERAVGDTTAEGRAFMEKIVQIIHDIPDPPPETLMSILSQELQQIADTTPHGPFYDRDWQNLLPEGLRPWFRTMRDIRRYLNAVPVTLRVVGCEVALVDVLGLEALRVFAPDAYAQVYVSVPELTGETNVIGEQEDDRGQRERASVEAIVAAAGPNAEAVRQILKWLFPRIARYVGRGTGESEGHARRDLRVADAGILRTYLGRALPPGVISGLLVRHTIDVLGDSSELEALLASLDAETLEGLVSRLEDYEHHISPDVVEPAVPVLLNQLPRLREGRRGMFDFGADLVLGRVILRLLRRVESETDLLAIVKRCLPRVDQLTGPHGTDRHSRTSAKRRARLGNCDGRYPALHPALRSTHQRITRRACI